MNPRRRFSFIVLDKEIKYLGTYTNLLGLLFIEASEAVWMAVEL